MREIDRKQLAGMEATARDIAKSIDGAINRGSAKKTHGFMLMIFSFKGPESTYISSANRADMKKMLKELLDRWEKGEQMPTTDGITDGG